MASASFASGTLPSDGMAMASTSGPAAANLSLHDAFAIAGLSPVLVGVVGIRWLIATVGVLLNGMLVWVTIRNKSLHGTCNLFIAFDALTSALYQSSNSISMAVVLFSDTNQIPLRICVRLMTYAIVAISLSLCATFLVGFERLLIILFPIIFGSKQKSKVFISSALTLSLAYSLYVLWECWQACLAVPDMPVICSISDCYLNAVGQMIFRNSMLLISISSLNYAVIWVAIKMKSSNSNKGKTSRSYTQKIFKSLATITGMVLFGWMLNATARFLLPFFQLNQMETFFISATLGCITNFVLSCNAPVLYAFSKDYRKAFNRFYHGIEMSGSSIERLEPNQLRQSQQRKELAIARTLSQLRQSNLARQPPN